MGSAMVYVIGLLLFLCCPALAQRPFLDDPRIHTRFQQAQEFQGQQLCYFRGRYLT
jgi:hypothetical protein